MQLLKANGYNAIRTSHNPVSPAFLDACDREGILVMDEAFDCWAEGKNTDDYHVHFDAWWQRDIASMVLRDRNHPSVVMWSIGNEVRHCLPRVRVAHAVCPVADSDARLACWVQPLARALRLRALTRPCVGPRSHLCISDGYRRSRQVLRTTRGRPPPTDPRGVVGRLQ